MSVLASLSTGSATFPLRRATVEDVPAIVELLAADDLGAGREDPTVDGPSPYLRAFEAIDADPAQLLVVLTTGEDAVVGTMQLTWIPGMSRRGAWRAQIEAVRIHRDHRGGGLGRAMFDWALDESRRRGCALVQLTTTRAGLRRTASTSGSDSSPRMKASS